MLRREKVFKKENSIQNLSPPTHKKKRRILKKQSYSLPSYYLLCKDEKYYYYPAYKKESTIKNAKIAEKSPLFYGVFSVYMIQQFPSDFSVAGTKETLFFEILRPHHYPLKKNLNF